MSYVRATSVLVSPLVTGVRNSSCVQLEVMKTTSDFDAFKIILMDLQTGRNITTSSGYTYAGQWKWMSVPSNFSAYNIIMTVSYYTSNSLSYYAGIDNIKVTPDFCPPIECDADEFLCGNGVVCYPASKKCDGSLDCEDASDEMECGEPSVDCDFNRVYICGYSGSNSRWYPSVDHTRTLVPSNDSGGAVALSYSSFSLALLYTPTINITQDLCFTFYTMAGNSRYIPSLLRVVRNESNSLSSLASFDTTIKNFWIRRSVNVSQGEFGLLFEFSPLHSSSLGDSDFVFIDDVQLRDGYCTKQECGDNQIYCSVEDSCISADLNCNQNNDCYAGEDERGCDFNVTCDFNNGLCGYKSTWTLVDDFMGLNSTEGTHSGQFLVSGSNGTTLNRTLVSPSVMAPGYSCISLDVAKIHLHPYSASFLYVRAYQTNNQYYLEVNNFGLLNSSWKHYEFTVQSYYYPYNLSLQISATTFQAYIALDNVKIVPGYCQSGGYSSTTPSPNPWWSTTHYPWGNSTSSPWWGNTTSSPSMWNTTISPWVWNTTSSPWMWNSTNSPLMWNTTISPWMWNTTNSPWIWNTTSSPLMWNTTSSPWMWNTTSSPWMWNTTNSPWMWNTTSSPWMWNTTNSPLMWNTTSSPLMWNTTSSPWMWNSTNSPWMWNTTNSPWMWNTTSSPWIWNTTSSPWMWNTTATPWWATTQNPWGNTTATPWWASTNLPWWTSSPSWSSSTTGIPFTDDGCYLISDYMCQLSYNTTMLPNVFGHTDFNNIQYQLMLLNRLLYQSYYIPSACVTPMIQLSCEMMYPKCENGTTEQICRNSCMAVSDLYSNECSPYSLGYNMSDFINYYCSFLPTENCREVSYNISEVIVPTPTYSPPSSTSRPMIGGVRFRAGSGTRNSGAVELQYNNVWRPICARYFFDSTADILCKELGFGGGNKGTSVNGTYSQSYSLSCGANRLDSCSVYVDNYCYTYSNISCFDNTPTCSFDGVGEHCGYDLSSWIITSSSVVLRNGGHSNVTSSEFTSPRKGSVRFLFKMTNQLTTTFKVHVLTGASSQVTDFSGYVPSVWLGRCVDLPSEQSMRLVFEGRLFAYDALYLDNVTVADQPCEGFPDTPCTFEDPAACPFSIDCPQKPSSFSWKLSKSIVTYSSSGTSSNTNVRLVGGTSPNNGRVEVFYSGVWGTVCDDLWDYKDAGVICFMLGYPRENAVAYSSAYFGAGTGQIWLDDLSCTGTETDIADCPFVRWGINDCGHSEDAGVACSGTKEIKRNEVPATITDRLYPTEVIMVANGSQGEAGQEATFTLPLNTSSGDILRVLLMVTQGSCDSHSVLQIKQTNAQSSFVLWTSQRSDSDSWRWLCLPLLDNVAGELEFKAIHGMSFTNDIAIDTIYVSKEKCPHAATCSFEVENDCGYVLESSSTQFQWTYGRMEGNDPIGDPTRGLTGHYMYTQSCRNNQLAREGATSSLISRQFPISSKMHLTFYYLLSGANTGVLSMSLKSDSNSVARRMFSRSGDRGFSWYKACVDIPSSNENVSLVVTASQGQSCNQTFALDNIVMEEGACPYPLVDEMCDFENPDLCRYQSNCTIGSKFQWARGSGETPSRDTGPYQDGGGNQLGHYMFVEASDGLPGHVTYLWFPSLETTQNSSLQFKYHMYGDQIGKLSVLALDSTGSVSELWSKTGNRWQYWHKACINIREHSQFVPYFVAEKGNGHRSDIALDDIVLLDSECSEEASLSCDFEDEFLCGYMNSSLTPWTWVDYSDTNHQSAVRNKTGNYMKSSSGDPAIMVSPSFTLDGSKSCVQFSFFSDNGGRNASMLIQLWEESEQATKRTVWNRTRDSEGYWQNGQFQLDIPAGNFRLAFLGESREDGFLAVDNITVVQGECPKLACPDGFFSCSDQCILNAYVCDKIPHCANEEDETLHCVRSISCDFEDSYHCGYINDTTSTPLQWLQSMAVDYTLVTDHTYQSTNTSTRGYFLAFQTTYSSLGGLLNAPRENTTSQSCLKFFTFGNRDLTVLIRRNGNLTQVSVPTINISTIWRPIQIPIQAGVLQIQFYWPYVYTTSSYPKYAGIDDVTLKNGTCPPIDCPAGMFTCGTTSCLPAEYRCNRRIDCESGEDEVGCPFNITCDFESNNWCGYSEFTQFGRRQGSFFYLPYADHTTQTLEGHYIYFSSEFGETANITSPVEYLKDGCLSFYYNMEGGPSAQLTVYVNTDGKSKLRFIKDGVGVRRDEWVRGQIPIKGGRIYVEFAAYGTDYFSKPGVVALDDVRYVEGESCPEKACLSSEFACNDTGTCIPGYLTRDGVTDCDDSSDEYAGNVSVSLVRLVGGADPSFGRLEIMDTNGVYKSVCEYGWRHQQESQVVCRELGYSRAVRTYNRSEYGLTSPRLYHGFLYSCGGSESSLALCFRSTRYSCVYGSKYSYQAQVSIACSNTECMYGERPCQPGSSNTTCLADQYWCDGNVDCPGAQDEENCGHCKADEFECQNHKCVPLSGRCDSINQCTDGSDEFRCVRPSTDTSGEVKVWKDGGWQTLCYNLITTQTAEYLCSVTGRGPLTSYSSGRYMFGGYQALPTTDTSSLIPHHDLQPVYACSALSLQCGSIECGVPSLIPQTQNMIIYGKEAQNGKWPWQISLQYSGSHICGGSIISPQWVLTAAHCVDFALPSSFTVGMGNVDKNKFYVDGQAISVSQLYTHPDYTSSSSPYYVDMALLRLARPIYYNNRTRPICLATQRTGLQNCYLTGWGRSHFEGSTPISPDILLETDVQVINNTVCRELWPSSVTVQDSVVCVDNREPYSPVCNGDSGGPLVCQDESGRWKLLGVTSRGSRGCVLTDYLPALYQGVPNALGWITSTTGLSFGSSVTPSPYTGIYPSTTPASPSVNTTYPRNASEPTTPVPTAPTAEPEATPQTTAEPRVNTEPTAEPEATPQTTAEPRVNTEPTAEPEATPETTELIPLSTVQTIAEPTPANITAPR